MNNSGPSQSNLFMAVILSMLVLFGFHYFYEKPRAEAARRAAALAEASKSADKTVAEVAPELPKDRAGLIAATQRLAIAGQKLQGSINLTGARFDDLTLPHYREAVAKDSPPITLFSPAGAPRPKPGYYADLGWLSDAPVVVPDEKTVWQTDDRSLTTGNAVTLRWNNGQGLRFERQIALDDHFMFTVTDRVTNDGDLPVTLHPYARLMHQTRPPMQDIGLGHVGPMGVFEGGVLREHGYSSLEESVEVVETGVGGWLGFSDKYWLSALIPNADEKINATFRYARAPEQKLEDGRYQVDFRGTPLTVPAKGSAEHRRRLFAGAKELQVLRNYRDALNIDKFELAIDFGWFRILTKPLMWLLNWLGGALGHVGLAILVLTVIVKLLVLPLGIRSYRSMARMKQLQPEQARLQERFKDDRQRFSIEVMELYRREKISPLSGCMPLLAQLPIFFALYKVLFIDITMRHAPFYGWIKDLSAPDPTTLFNLFGLLPFTPPAMLTIGIWPILMGASMFYLQKMSPQPPDPLQAKVIMWMPVVFTIMLAPTMASGLIIYWTWSNIISIAQQYLIFRRMAKH